MKRYGVFAYNNGERLIGRPSPELVAASDAAAENGGNGVVRALLEGEDGNEVWYQVPAKSRFGCSVWVEEVAK